MSQSNGSTVILDNSPHSPVNVDSPLHDDNSPDFNSNEVDSGFITQNQFTDPAIDDAVREAKGHQRSLTQYFVPERKRVSETTPSKSQPPMPSCHAPKIKSRVPAKVHRRKQTFVIDEAECSDDEEPDSLDLLNLEEKKNWPELLSMMMRKA
jgi:hypothetical protein